MPDSPRISVSISPGALAATGNVSTVGNSHQTVMEGSGSYLYFTPDVARQWIGVLSGIAAAGDSCEVGE